MVFSPATPFLDHHNWQQQVQQSNYQQENGGGVENPNFQSPLQHGGGGSIRAGSMVDRARLANLPMPEPGLNCPRCDSTNTKFCYFNNYNLTQPRHFCKTCRRYWTRGGALRNVPVGGGCRRNNKRKNNTRSRSPSQIKVANKSSISGSPSRCSNENISTSTHLPNAPSLQFPFMSSYGGNITSNLGGFHPQNEMSNFQLGNGGSNGNNMSNIHGLSIGSGQNWRLPFLAGFEVPNNNNTNLFHFQSQGAVETPASSIVDNSQADGHHVKVDQENQGQNLSRQVLGVSDNTNQQQPWQVGNNWAELSGANTSSTCTTHFI